MNLRRAFGAIGTGIALGGVLITVSRCSELEAARGEAPTQAELAAGSSQTSKPTTRRDVNVRAVPAPNQEGELVLRASWGGAPGELGRRAAEESSPEGPMSFVVDEEGRAVVLDQVNGRIQIFEDGQVARVVPLPSDTFQDVAIRGDGLVALDRLGDETVAFIDASGKVTHEVPLQGAGVESGGEVTALAQHDDGTWVEVKHQGWVRVADADGAPDAGRPTMVGRVGPEGTALRLARAGGARASLVRIGHGGAQSVTFVTFDQPIWALDALETDAAGRVYIGAELAVEREVEPFDVLERMAQVIVLDTSGTEVARLALPPSTGAEETFRTLRVGPDGALYQLVFDALGATMRRYRL